MGNAGIIINLNIDESDVFLPTAINSREIDTSSENLPIDSYKFCIQNGFKTYNIGFRLEHRV